MPQYLEESLLRDLLFRVLKANAEWRNFGGIVEGIKNLARMEKLFPELLARNPHDNYYENNNLRPEDQWTIHRLIWELIVEGIMVPGHDIGNDKWPNLSLTPHGRHVIEQVGPTPYDPDAYFGSALKAANQINPTTMIYLKESVDAFRRGLFLASAVMLGVASESAFLTLAEAVSRSRTGGLAEKIARAPTLKKKHEVVIAQAILGSGTLEKNTELKERVEMYLGELFQAYRLTRNDAGHPTGRVIPRDVVLVNLTVFPQYLRTVADLIQFIGSQTGVVPP